MLKQLMNDIGSQDRAKKNLQSGFRACGIYPFDPEEVYKKLKGETAEDPGQNAAPDNSLNASVLSDAVLDVLRSMHFDKRNTAVQRKKRLQVEPESEQSDDATSEDVQLPTEWSVGDFVAVVYELKWYVATIEKISNEEKDVFVSFMLQPSDRNQFTWPTKKDACWVPFEKILLKLSRPPEPVSSRFFSICESDFVSIQSKFSAFKDSI
uniref:Tudor domain-containing protein n=1 Tax=Romanomermis culicivorax TaxID=13658 RepID=A0A915HWP0_ROMCU